MQTTLQIYNTLSRKKEAFHPLHPPFVGMYLCGPTVYGHAHLGHARNVITFDVIFRYLEHLGYKVRFVRNVTDVGHLENDADEGEDKIAKQARLSQQEPMEIAQQCLDAYHREMDSLNVRRPHIEPKASGHITEQIQMIEAILEKGLAYVINGSVYFDVLKYHESHHYGKLSGRLIEDLISGTRALQGQQEKRSSLDFALWKKASPAHIMRWPSPWSEGFPGWHLECSAMSSKYLGRQFDIHGGGMDLCFPHHECEIAQSQATYGKEPAKYWVHNNLITINGQKMGKSLGNTISLEELFTGKHGLLDQPYSPMTLRFFILQAHYRSTLDFSIQALTAAKAGYIKLMNGIKTLNKINSSHLDPTMVDEIDSELVRQIEQTCHECTQFMSDDFNTAKTIAALFSLLKHINALHYGQLPIEKLGIEAFQRMKKTYFTFTEDVLGLKEEQNQDIESLINILLRLYSEAKAKKDYDQVDHIRRELLNQGIVVQDLKKGVDWAYEA